MSVVNLPPAFSTAALHTILPEPSGSVEVHSGAEALLQHDRAGQLVRHLDFIETAKSSKAFHFFGSAMRSYEYFTSSALTSP